MNPRQKDEKPRTFNVFQGNGNPMTAEKVNRNAPCYCGSGKKQKRCCGDTTKYYHTEAKKEELKK